jgi:predicted ribonuclease YlaK
MVTSLIESMQWTVVIPLPVIMELDGLSSNVNPQLAEAASSAVTYITTHIRSHSVSLKVQTSKGNYLTNLNVRTEDIDFSESVEKSMDDLILKAAIWQDDHWVDRSNMLKVDSVAVSQTANAVKVVFISLDRNCKCIISLHRGLFF